MTSTILYAPNILNYIRLVLALSTIFLPSVYFIIFYGIVSFLDLIDGEFARSLGQTSVLGACMDMFTDRISACIIIFRILQLVYALKFKELHANEVKVNIEKSQMTDDMSCTDFIQRISLYQEKIMNNILCNQLYDKDITFLDDSKMLTYIVQPAFLLFFLCIDILAHNFLFTASKIKNHNHKEGHYFSILAIYYIKPILILLCISTEIFFVTLYAYLYLRLNVQYSEKTTQNSQNHSILNFCKNVMYFTFPGCMIRALFNVVQLLEGIVQLGRVEQ